MVVSPSSSRSASWGWRRRRWSIQRRLGRDPRAPSRFHTTGDDRSVQRVEVRLTGEHRVERSQPRGDRQQRLGRAAVPGLLVVHPGAQKNGASAVERFEVDVDGNLDQSPGLVERSGLVLGECRGERTLRAQHRIRRQLGRALQERRGRRQATPGSSANGRRLELGRDLLVDPLHRLRTVPGAAIGIGRYGGLGQRAMHPSMVLGFAAWYTADRTSGWANRTRAGPISNSPADSAATAAWTSRSNRAAARSSSAGSPVGSAAAISSSSCVSGGRSRSVSGSCPRCAAGHPRRTARHSLRPAARVVRCGAAPAGPADCRAPPR